MRFRAPFLLMLALAIVPARAVGPNDALNDTGITKYGDAAGNSLTVEPASHPGQDARFGRDPKASVGVAPRAGFDFTTLPGGCVRDNVTKLAWEVKTTDTGLRDRSWKYTWYNSNPATNGGSVGTLGENGTPFAVCGPPPSPGSIGVGCETETFVTNVNSAGLCGFNDWRMPTLKELESIVDFARFQSTTIDPTFFPHTVDTGYYSSTASAADQDSAWFVDFFFGNAATGLKNKPTQVRLVRDAP